MNDRLAAMIKASERIEVREKADRMRELSNMRGSVQAAKYAKAHPDKMAAREALHDAVRTGRIEKPDTCIFDNQFCRGFIEAHHWRGYDEAHWLDVLWVCQRHHELIEPED